MKLRQHWAHNLESLKMSLNICWAKNTSGADKTWVGQLISNSAYYQIQDGERHLWQNDDTVLSDISSGNLTVAKDDSGTNDISGVSDQLNWLKNIDPSPRDSDGAKLSRTKITQSGWTFDQRSVKFTTAKLSSVRSNKYDNSSWGDVTLTLYDAQGNQITQTQDEANCVKTIIDWEPNYDYDLIAGVANVITLPTGYAKDAYMWNIFVPDLTPAQGGTVVTINDRTIISDVINVSIPMSADGRVPKTMYYDAVYHTNKIRTQIIHKAGDQIKIEMLYDHYWDRSTV